MSETPDFDALAYRDTIEEMSTAHLTRLDEEADKLTAALHTINEQRRLIRGVLRTINPPEPKPAPKAKKGNASVSISTVQSVREFLLAHADADVTTRFVMDEMALSKDRAGASLKILRDQGFLRLAGRAPGQGAPIFYRVMDDAAVNANGS